MSNKQTLKETEAHRKMMRRSEAADYLGVSNSFLAKLAVYGGGPVMVKAGRTVLYDPDDLDAWIAVRKVSSTSEAINAA